MNTLEKDGKAKKGNDNGAFCVVELNIYLLRIV